MKNKLFLNILSSGLQAISVQILGGVFFYLVSIYTSKNDFGAIGWANALGAFLVTILSCGMEQVVVRRIASSKTSDWAATAYIFHALTGSFILFIALYFATAIFKNDFNIIYYLMLFFGVQCISYIASPLRQFLNAKEKFAPYAVIAFISNLGKIILLCLSASFHKVSIEGVAIILVICSLFELAGVLVYILSVSEFAFKFKFKFTAYGKLVKESMPQYLSVIFNSSLNRIDWILLGFLSTNIVTAEYSFAYRAYEMANLPVVILGPIILTKYSKILSYNKLSEQKSYETGRFFVIEIFLAVLIVLLLNILWIPVIGTITYGKYGSSNSLIFLILSLCLPFNIFYNLLWTLCFSARQYKEVSKIIMTVAIGNFMLNLILIPFYGGLGAAISYLLSMIAECILFFITVNKSIMKFSFMPMIILFSIGAFSYFFSSLITNLCVKLLFALILYIGLSLIFGQLKKNDFAILRAYLK